MSFLQQMEETRDKLLSKIEASNTEYLRGIADAEADSKARFEKLRSDAEESRAVLIDVLHEAYGKPEEKPEEKPEASETIIT